MPNDGTWYIDISGSSSYTDLNTALNAQSSDVNLVLKGNGSTSTPTGGAMENVLNIGEVKFEQVASIGGGFLRSSSVKSVVCDESTTTLGNESFRLCHSMTSFIANGVTTLGTTVFEMTSTDDSSLTYLELAAAGEITVGTNAFSTVKTSVCALVLNADKFDSSATPAADATNRTWNGSTWLSVSAKE